MLNDYTGTILGGGLVLGFGLIMLDNYIEILSWLIMYAVICIGMYCIRYYLSNTARAPPASTDGKTVGDNDALILCPCCKRQYYPITDISNRRMCPWCGHYVGRWFYRNILNYSYTIKYVCDKHDR